MALAVMAPLTLLLALQMKRSFELQDAQLTSLWADAARREAAAFDRELATLAQEARRLAVELESAPRTLPAPHAGWLGLQQFDAAGQRGWTWGASPEAPAHGQEIGKPRPRFADDVGGDAAISFVASRADGGWEVAWLSRERVQSQLRRPLAAPVGARVVLLDAEGNTLASVGAVPASPTLGTGRTQNGPSGAARAAVASTNAMPTPGGRPDAAPEGAASALRWAWAPVGLTGWTIGIEVPMAALEDGQATFALQSVLLLALCLIAGVVLALWLADRLHGRPGMRLDRGLAHMPAHEVARPGPAGSGAQPQTGRDGDLPTVFPAIPAGTAPMRSIRDEPPLFDPATQRQMWMSLRREEDANRAKDEFLALLGHELRNPLNAVATAAEVMKIAPPGSEAAREARSAIGRQTRHFAKVLDDLLEMARVVAGELALEPQPVDLAQLVSAQVEVLRGAGALPATVVMQTRPVWVEVDRPRLQAALGAYLQQLVRAPSWASPLAVRVVEAEGHAELELRAPGTASAAVQGSLPLVLLRRLVQLQGGTLQASCNESGVLVQLRLPRIDAPPAEPASSRRPRPRSILLIDRDIEALRTLQARLQLDGHALTTATDGRAGLALLLSQRPEIAVIDIDPPESNGLELARSSRGAGYAGRLVALTGLGLDVDARQRSMQAGFDVYLSKPMDDVRLGELFDTE